MKTPTIRQEQVVVALTPVVRELGMDLYSVRLAADAAKFIVRLRTVPSYVEVDLEPEYGLSIESCIDMHLKMLTDARRVLFAGAAKRMAEHDRSPHDRLEQIESAARAFYDEVKRRGLMSGAESTLLMQLMALIDTKPGAVSWSEKP